MLDSTYRKQFGRNEIVFRQGDPGYYACIIESGVVEVSIEHEGRSTIVSRLEQGAVFGEMALIDEHSRSATIRTVEPTKLVVITREQFLKEMDDTQPIVRMFMRVLLNRFRRSEKRLHEMIDDRVTLIHEKINDDDDYRTLHDVAITQLRMESRLIKAIEQKEFCVFYQPIMHLSSNRIAGFEALVRWHDPERGIVPPIEFICLAERTGLIKQIGQFVLQQACHDLKLFEQKLSVDKQRPALFMSVNLSAGQLRDHEIIDHLDKAVRESGVDPRQVKLEITESLLMEDPELATQLMSTFKDRGFMLAIDDFGTGYSSLSYLHQFPFDTLKIDRSFISKLSEDDQSCVITAGIANLARSLGLKIVAEGVEESHQLKMLEEYLCDYVQGYLISRPVPFQDAIEQMNVSGALSA